MLDIQLLAQLQHGSASAAVVAAAAAAAAAAGATGERHGTVLQKEIIESNQKYLVDKEGKTENSHRQCGLLEVSAERNTVSSHRCETRARRELIQEFYLSFIKDKTFLSQRNLALDTTLH
uniref:Uncharacterized protein n=1 Tax=Oryza punctata TaxID=4537 RepID=A0A0E0MD73_ORYPU